MEIVRTASQWSQGPSPLLSVSDGCVWWQLLLPVEVAPDPSPLVDYFPQRRRIGWQLGVFSTCRIG
ncbi:hypothetical protein CRG98_007869 [Punica granatum]|uniref:Uncharacterized protein n=1 Tax=Punica granatum TaxID=22663 RepID=A0A2I0KV53_PUNGR|nr:hypothetical protein CRG98_007869 [Punica granatum]